MNIATLSADQALASLSSGPAGLSTAEAARRLGEFGPNRVEEVTGVPLWWRLGREFTHFFALILWLAAGLAFAAEHYDPGQGMAELGVAIIGVIAINGLFSFWQEYRAQRAVEALRRLLPHQAKVVRDGVVSPVDVTVLVPGDVVVLEAGELIPADCRLIEAFAVRVNLATLTGEAAPKARQADAVPNGPALAARNLVLAGTTLVSGQARGAVYATGMRTEFGRIAHLTQTAGETTSSLQREIGRLSRLVAMLATGLGVAFFLIGRALGLPFWDNVMFAIGIIVANVPEGLLPTVTLSLAMATQRMARRNALVRHLPAVETLGSTTVICSDKTGTLTLNRMTVKRLYADETHSAPEDWRRSPHQHAATPHLLRAAALCHNVQPARRDGRFEYLGDPLEVALVEFAAALGLPVIEGLLGEIPFDSDRRRMSVVVADGRQRVLYCKGALEAVLEVADGAERHASVEPLDAAARQRFLEAEAAMASDGLRVLAFAWRVLEEGEHAAEEKLIVAGLIGLEDPPRAEVPAAVARCHDAGIRVIMVTGDHPRTALAIAREVGLVRSVAPVVLRGEEIGRLSAAQLQLALDAPEVLFARVSAEQKMLIVQALQRKGEVVAVTGDGVNDAPALKTADIGIAMGLTGTDVAKEAADMILLDDNFATIVNAVEEGRAVFENLRKFLTYILTSNIPELVPYLAYVLFRIPLPLTIIQILAVDLGTDMLPALALGAERPDPAVMQRPPRRRAERLLNLSLILRAYLFLGVMEAAVALAAFFFVLGQAGWTLGDALARTDPLYLQATTACLAGIVAAQMVNVFLCRHPQQPLWRFPLAGNRLLLWGIAFELGLILLIVYTPLGNRLFGTAPLAIEVWLFALPCVLAMALLEEARKALARALVPRPS